MQCNSRKVRPAVHYADDVMAAHLDQLWLPGVQRERAHFGEVNSQTPVKGRVGGGVPGEMCNGLCVYVCACMLTREA